MQEKQLAIASVPVQRWGALYPDDRALEEGTVFEELNMPFFMAETCENRLNCRPSDDGRSLHPDKQKEREAMIQKICQTGFVLDDLTLYLDTHPKDKEALSVYLEKSMERKMLKHEFAKRFYPLTRDCIADDAELTEFSWQDGPMPWEGACL